MIEAVAERLEGAPVRLRRRWSDELKDQAIADSLVPGANVSEIARRIGIGPSQLFDWRRKALRKGSVSLTAPQLDASPEPATSASAFIEIVVGDIVIRADAMADEAHLRRVVRAVRSA
ncbi:MAG: transposase [Methylovirgula sp.]|uniref:transposase n=1 Tax=Methylovirgula sp. TaxID=1978224 RepID=UPI0030763326